MKIWKCCTAVDLVAYVQLSINMVLEVDATALTCGTALRLDVAHIYPVAVKSKTFKMQIAYSREF